MCVTGGFSLVARVFHVFLSISSRSPWTNLFLSHYSVVLGTSIWLWRSMRKGLLLHSRTCLFRHVSGFAGSVLAQCFDYNGEADYSKPHKALNELLEHRAMCMDVDRSVSVLIERESLSLSSNAIAWIFERMGRELAFPFPKMRKILFFSSPKKRAAGHCTPT